MKHMMLVCLLVAGALPAIAEPHVLVGPLKLVRVRTSGEAKDGLREYLPPGESFERWTRLASVRIIQNQKDPKKYLGAVAQAVTKSDPNARYQFFEDKKTKKFVLDFLVFSPARAPASFAEWNLMRAEYLKGKGLVVHQYAMRMYHFDGGQAINAERERTIEPFKEASFEEVSEVSRANNK